MYNTYPKAGVERDGSSMTNYYERRGRIPAFSSLAIYRYGTSIVGEPGSTEREPVTLVSPDFFPPLGAGPAMGRVFTEAETSCIKPTTSRLSLTAYWREHFSAEPQVTRRKIRVDGLARDRHWRAAPASAFSLQGPVVLSAARRVPSSGRRRTALGRECHPNDCPAETGRDSGQAQAQIDAQNAALEADDPQARMMADAGFRTLVVPLHADQVARFVRLCCCCRQAC